MSTLETSTIRPVSGAVRGAFGILLAVSGYTFLVLFVFSGRIESPLYLGALLWFVVSGPAGLTLSAWLRDPTRT